MNGVGNARFAPNGKINTGMIVTLLARMAKADLSQYAYAAAVGDIPTGKWYSSAALWARDAGLIPAEGFDPSAAMTRGQLAVMLVKYFDYMKIPYTAPTEPTVFADAGDMTIEENAAFQILYSLGIFKGVGGSSMNVGGSTSRAEMSALSHRIADYTAAHTAVQ